MTKKKVHFRTFFFSRLTIWDFGETSFDERESSKFGRALYHINKFVKVVVAVRDNIEAISVCEDSVHSTLGSCTVLRLFYRQSVIGKNCNSSMAMVFDHFLHLLFVDSIEMIFK